MGRSTISRLAALCITGVGVISSLPAWSQTVDANSEVSLNIPAQSLDAALLELSRQASFQLILSAGAVPTQQSPFLSGRMSIKSALDRLLKGTDLSYKWIGEHTVAVTSKASTHSAPVGSGRDVETADAGKSDDSLRVAQADQRSDSSESSVKKEQGAQTSQKPSPVLEEIVVTGTHIRGAAPAGSPLNVYTQEDIARSGASTVDHFIEKLPQNFAGGASQGNQLLSSNSDARSNYGYGGSVNLRGLGTGTTLTLLNGHRMAPSGTDGSFVDITMIPASAIDRIEILTDGASAVYGSDAIGGVANFVLRRDFEGLQSSVRYGSDTHNIDEIRAVQTFGTKWQSGSLLLSYEYNSRDPLRVADRSFASGISVPSVTLLPGQVTNSVLTSVQQAFGDRFETFADVLYSNRRARDTYFASNGVNNVGIDDRPHNEAVNVSLGLSYHFLQSWQMSLSGTYSSDHVIDRNVGSVILDRIPYYASLYEKVRSGDVQADGILLTLPGGDVRLAAGGSYRRENSDINYADPPPQTRDRSVTSAFSEVLIPVFGRSNERLGLRELQISLAGRYDHYSDFGNSTVPKVGITYSPVTGLSLRGSYGRSFRAPLLQEQIGEPSLLLLSVRNPASPSGHSITLVGVGSNLSLKPESARTWSTGFDLAPQSLPLKLSVTYFDISFTNRIQHPSTGFADFVLNPQLYGSYVAANPSEAFINQQVAAAAHFVNFSGQPFNPAAVDFWANDRLQNTAIDDENGLDASLSSKFSGAGGVFDLGLAGTYLFNYKRSITPFAPFVSYLNERESLLKFRGRALTSWDRAGFGATAALNYANAYENRTVIPTEKIASWTTVDLQLRYGTLNTLNPHFLNNLQLSLNLENAFDRRPPHASGVLYDANYDPANASPLGRFISVEIGKKW